MCWRFLQFNPLFEVRWLKALALFIAFALPVSLQAGDENLIDKCVKILASKGMQRSYRAHKHKRWLVKNQSRISGLKPKEIILEYESHWKVHEPESSQKSRAAFLKILRTALKQVKENQFPDTESFNKGLNLYASVLRKDMQLQEASWVYREAGNTKLADEVERQIIQELKQADEIRDQIKRAKIGEDTTLPTYVFTMPSGLQAVWKPSNSFSMRGVWYDTGTNEVTAYEADRSLKKYRVPVTVRHANEISEEDWPKDKQTPFTKVKSSNSKEDGLVEGTLQAFVHGKAAQEIAHLNYEEALDYKQSLALFDFYYGNPDRSMGKFDAVDPERDFQRVRYVEQEKRDNKGNFLITELSLALGLIEPVAIDHHIALRPWRDLKKSQHLIHLYPYKDSENDTIEFPVNREEYERIRTQNLDEVSFSQYIDPTLMLEWKDRQKMIVDFIEDMRKKRGDHFVFGINSSSGSK